MTRRLVVALIAAALPALLPSGPILASQKQSFSSRTLGVRVDVLVTDGRNPVGGLSAPDFELRDNGVVQRIEVVDPSRLHRAMLLRGAFELVVFLDQHSRASV